MDVLVYVTGVLVLGVGAQWIAWRLQVPSILLLLVCGFVAGAVTNPLELVGENLLYPLVSLAVAVVLFEGGLSLRFRDLQDVGSVVLRLVTVGVLLTWGLAGLAAWLCLGFDPLMAALAGAILSLTGPTVIIPMLQQIRPSRRVGSIAKWEAIVIDPVAATLAVLTYEVVRTQEFNLSGSASQLELTALVGGVVGLGSAAITVQLLRRYLIPDFLQNAYQLAAVVAAFTLSNELQPESGLVAVTVFGVALANQRSATVKHLMEFKEHLRVLLISTLFVVLASLVDPRLLFSLGPMHLLFLVTLLLIRPIAVWVATVGSRVTWAERVLLSCLAPRGIVSATVASLFAVQLAALADTGDLPASVGWQARQLAPLTFFVIVSTVVIYGIAAPWIARRLGLAEVNRQGLLIVGAEPFARAIGAALVAERIPVTFVDTNRRNIAACRLAGLSGHCANILSDYAQEEIDFSAIGRLLAMTGSTEVNTLATLEFAHVFGRSGVYQLRVSGELVKRDEPLPAHLRARPLFGGDVSYARLVEAFSEGSTVKKTKLSEEFTLADYVAQYGAQAMILFVLEPNGLLRIVSEDQATIAPAGSCLISLVSPLPSESVATNSIAAT